VVKALEQLVNIETGTGNAEGMAAAGQYLEQRVGQGAADLEARGASLPQDLRW